MSDDRVDVLLAEWAQHTEGMEPPPGRAERWAQGAARLASQRQHLATWRAMLLVAAAIALLAHGWAQFQLSRVAETATVDGGLM